MGGCPPVGHCASGEDEPSKSDNPPASCTPNPAGEEAQGESVSRGDDVSQAASQSPELKKKKVSSAYSGPMTEWHQAALVALQGNLKLSVKMFQLSDMLEKSAGGFMDRAEVLKVRSKAGDMEQMGELISILLGKEDMAFYSFCDLLQRSNYEVWARKLKSEAERFKTEGAPNEGSQTARRISVSKTTSPALTRSSDNDILHTYTTGIIACDMDIIRSQKEPEKAIKSLFFNTYKMLICILHDCFGSIKASALDAVLMEQVDATEEEVNQAQDLSTLFKCLSIHGNWNKLHFLDVAIISLPPEELVKKEAALLVLGQYKSYLRAYQKATAMKEGKSECGLLQRKRGREERWVVTEVIVDKDITDYTYEDCLELWKLFLIKALEIPEDYIKFHLARAGSTMLVFMIMQTYAEDTKEKLSKPAAMWVMKELGILRVHVAGVVSVDLREVLPNVLNASIREGLVSGVDFSSLTKVSPPLMHSLLDPASEPKKTQPGGIKPYSGGPAELSVQEPAVDVHPPLMCSLVDRVSELKETQLGTVQPYSTGPAGLSVQEPVVELLGIRSSYQTPRAAVNEEDTGYRSGVMMAAQSTPPKIAKEKKDNPVGVVPLSTNSRSWSSYPTPSTTENHVTSGYGSGATESQTSELLPEGEEHPKSIGQSTTDAFTATSEHQDRSEQDEGNVDENKEVEERPSGELLSSRADYTTEDLGQNTADAFTATSEYQTRPEQDVGYDARCSKLVVGHTHCLPKVTNMDAVLIGVKMIQLSDSHKLSLCI